MKKIAALSVAALLALAAFASCDSGTKYVTAHSVFDSTSLTLPIEFDSAHSGGSFTYFTSRKSLPELKEELEGAEDFSVVSIQLYEHCILIEKEGLRGILNSYYLAEAGEAGEDGARNYQFGVSCLETSVDCCIPVPLHLMELDPADLETGDFYYFFPDTAYPAAADAEAFAAYHAKSGVFGVEQSGDKISVSLKEGVRLSTGVAKYGGTPFALTFSEDGEQNFVTYSVEAEQ